MVRRSSDYATAAELDARAAGWLAKIRGAVAPRPRLRLDPRRAALLVVDMQRYFVSPAGRCFLPAARAMLPRLAALLDAWRATGAAVTFTRHGHSGDGDLGMLGRFYSDHIRLGEPDSELAEELVPLAGEAVLPKTTYDAFLGTDLEERLRRDELDQVLVCGVLTHLCCETTARAAFCRGFEVYVAADATATSSEELHVGSLLALADGVAVVMSSGEIIETCARHK